MKQRFWESKYRLCLLYLNHDIPISLRDILQPSRSDRYSDTGEFGLHVGKILMPEPKLYSLLLDYPCSMILASESRGKHGQFSVLPSPPLKGQPNSIFASLPKCPSLPTSPYNSNKSGTEIMLPATSNYGSVASVSRIKKSFGDRKAC
jgi:hypothetical protein